MSDEEIKAELERLRKENAALKKGASSGIRLKVSEKGAVSVYGLGRFPVTLYKEQWLKLLDMSDDIRAFIAANEAQLNDLLRCGPDSQKGPAPNFTKGPERANWRRVCWRSPWSRSRLHERDKGWSLNVGPTEK